MHKNRIVTNYAALVHQSGTLYTLLADGSAWKATATGPQRLGTCLTGMQPSLTLFHAQIRIAQ